MTNLLPPDHLFFSSALRVKALILEELGIDSHDKSKGTISFEAIIIDARQQEVFYNFLLTTYSQFILFLRTFGLQQKFSGTDKVSKFFDCFSIHIYYLLPK